MINEVYRVATAINAMRCCEGRDVRAANLRLNYILLVRFCECIEGLTHVIEKMGVVGKGIIMILEK